MEKYNLEIKRCVNIEVHSFFFKNNQVHILRQTSPKQPQHMLQ